MKIKEFIKNNKKSIICTTLGIGGIITSGILLNEVIENIKLQSFMAGARIERMTMLNAANELVGEEQTAKILEKSIEYSKKDVPIFLTNGSLKAIKNYNKMIDKGII